MPRYKKYVPHDAMPDAIAHSQIHTKIYHENVFTVLMKVDLVAVSKEDITEALKEIAEDLQAGIFPISKLLRKI